jgi:hypothetical protein
MSKVRTLNSFQEKVDSELAWRIREIAFLASEVSRNRPTGDKTLIRASTALVYAHWEGFVKNAATLYLLYIEGQRHKYTELTTAFAVIGLKGKLATITDDGPNRSAEAFEFVKNELGSRAVIPAANTIITESNLSSSVLKKILETIGLESQQYSAYANFIDKSLLKKRNSIAHGNFEELDRDAWIQLKDTTILLIRKVKTDLENAATLKKYLC